MGTGLFIALLNPSISLVLAAGFGLLWLHRRKASYLGILSVGYAAAAAGFLLQYFTLPLGFAATKLLSGIVFTVATACVAAAVTNRYARRAPLAGIAFFSAAAFAAMLWFMFVQPNLTWRILSVNFAFGGIALLVCAEMWAVRQRGPLQKALAALSLCAALNFTLRTLVILWLRGTFQGYEGLYHSPYWTTTLLSHALLSLGLALTLFTGAAMDAMATLKADSHTDPLSKLLNRRGFEERAMRLLERCDRARVPVALVLADLDHFKAVNDAHGHEAGDRVIVEFAKRLNFAAGSRAVAARMGGEEFAVLLPLTDLGSARLFAEAIRTVFCAGPVAGLPHVVRLTASFGVAARSGAEGLAPLLRRADEALYKAKQSGRNSVRISYQRPQPVVLIAAAQPLAGGI